jgi:hypothetical protein
MRYITCNSLPLRDAADPSPGQTHADCGSAEGLQRLMRRHYHQLPPGDHAAELVQLRTRCEPAVPCLSCWQG